MEANGTIWSNDSLRNSYEFSPAMQNHLKRVTSSESSTKTKRLYLLFLFALLKGASVGPTIMLVIDFDSSVLVTAFVGTAVAFVCFSAAAMLATRREYLYHGASLACCMSILWWVQIASSIFGGSTTVVKFELYFGLLIFVGYIVVDTQMIIEKAHHGDMDYVQHSFTFFTDFASLFVQILVLNMFRKMKKGRKDRRN
ncbi:unnamed protein product [Arabidopsis thaliana]|uniref:Bax inhibitor-1 family protein n=1 Tax=Arabidopsis thaliana TaxID=3702 RepID=A0A654FQ94_ARATH|nr:unnamed protein product [Arabidopsis thaliana]